MKNPVELLSKKGVDAITEMAAKGGKLAKMHRGIEAFETFLRTPKTKTSGSVHIRDGVDSKRVMTMVIIALLPTLFFALYNTGYQKLSHITSAPTPDFFGLGSDLSLLNCMIQGAWVLLPMLIVSYVTGLTIEFVFSTVRDHEVNEGFLVTGMLIPLIMPPEIPLWMVAVGTAFGVIFGKEVFGGTGYNFLNPALTARAFIFFSYPTKISGDEVWIAVNASKEKLIDGFSGATPLAIAASSPRGPGIVEALNAHHFSFSEMFYGLIPGSMGETSTLMILLGAAFLIITGVASWRVMTATVVGALAMGGFLQLFAGPNSLAYFHLPAYYHLVMGGFAFGAVFMTTDPVSAAATNTGKWIYGILIGVLVVLIRTVNPAYPEGMMLAILFMNVFAPLIDQVVVRSNIKRRLSRVHAS